MELTDEPPVKSGGPSTAHGDQAGSYMSFSQIPSGGSMDAGSDAASYLSDVMYAASGNIAEQPGNPRPSHRVVPPDESGAHQVTFTVTISVALPPGETVCVSSICTICLFL